jgi:FkbM family methyltransferase
MENIEQTQLKGNQELLSKKISTNHIKSMQFLEFLYESLLCRHMNSEEQSRITKDYLDYVSKIEKRQLVSQMMKSDEFMRIYRSVILDKLIPHSQIVCIEKDGFEIFIDLREIYIGWGILNSWYEAEEIAFVKSQIKSGMTFLDVGANIGYYTMTAAHLVGSEGLVIAIEPLLRSYHLLERSVLRNNFQDRVELWKKAASSEKSLVQLSYNTNTQNMGGAGIIENDISFSDSNSNVSIETVEAYTIDDIVQNRAIDFVKMDIEGAEGLAIQGADRLLSSRKATLMIEFNESRLNLVSKITSSELISQIKKLDYKVFKLVNKTLQPIDEISLVLKELETKIINLIFIPNF